MKRWIVLLACAMVVTFCIELPDTFLHIISCDVGQGDASLIVYQDVQVLIDAGKPASGVEECLSRHIPFWDKQLELIVITHPQLDHFGGFIDIFSSYDVETVLTSRLDGSTQEYQVLRDVMSAYQPRLIHTETTTQLRYGLMYLDIVWPTEKYVRDHSRMKERDISGNTVEVWETSEDLNNFSIVLSLRLGEFDGLFTGDIGPDVSSLIINTKQLRDVEYIKVPHHGSKNGLTKELLDVTNPEVAVISSGKGNSFGHPHKEVIELLHEAEVRTYRTDTEGDVELITDGKQFWIR